jgi:outer membrane protein TolC
VRGQIVGTPAPPGTLNPTPTAAIGLPSTAIPAIVDQYLVQIAMIVPVSDYFLRISKSYTAATHAEEAARSDLLAAKVKSLSDGKIAYYTWVRARGSTVVAQQTLAVARAHLHDAEVLASTGSASKADVLRAKTAVAAAELVAERAKNGASLSERQVRLAIHAAADEKIEPGESLDRALPAPGDSNALVSEAHANRPEVKSIDQNAEAARRLASAARAAYIPSLSARTVLRSPRSATSRTRTRTFAASLRRRSGFRRGPSARSSRGRRPTSPRRPPPRATPTRARPLSTRRRKRSATASSSR